MKMKQLKSIADEGSIEMGVNADTGIVGVKFTVNEVAMTAQFSSSGAGIYAFCFVSDDDDLVEFLQAARRGSKTHRIDATDLDGKKTISEKRDDDDV